MEQKEVTIRRPLTETRSSEAGPGGDSEELLPHVRGWGGVAREARERCEKGAEAVKKVRLRRNRSGE